MVEDSALDEKMIQRHLQRHGLVAEFRRVWTADDFRTTLSSFSPHVILSDYSMPTFDGKTALRMARELAPDVPFIFVSGTIGEERAIEALKNGATDYVIKTNLARLGPAVESALRQAADNYARKEAEEARGRLIEILEATTDFVAICDTQNRIEYLNAGACRLLGRSREALLGQTADSIYPLWAHQLLMREAIPSTLRDGSWLGESALMTDENEEIPVSQVVVAHRDRNGEVRFFSTIARDIRERKAYESRISYLANFDGLTGLPNRALLHDRALQSIAHAKRIGRQLAVAVINIDHFALVNGGYGRATGDQLLREIASRITNATRDGDTVARLDADSYAVLLADVTTSNEVIAAAYKITQAIKPPLRINDRELRVTATLGISLFPRDGEDPDSLLRNADAAMRRAKEQEHGGVQFYTAKMTSEAVERIEIATALQTAVSRGELAVHYQPQFDIRTRRITGVEALLRWFNPQRGTIPPDRFIPLAEESGIIRSIGEWVLTQACADALKWRKAGLAIPRIGVNVSARQLHSGIVGAVENALANSGLHSSVLELEVTESGLITDADESIDTLRRLKALGVSVAIDDFGTGYSSLSYLSRFPLDRLKIDRSFVQRMTTDANNRQIVQAIVSLARTLNLDVIAEGVETEEQRKLLADDCCSEGQGYLVSPALSADEIMTFLSANNETR
jgi:diguanylate cyclase (GGDEF)-like protein/PAS domain S-box-containing protein